MITAVVLEGRSASDVARHYGVSRSWVYELVARYRAEGDLAFEPRSRRPATRPDATVELVLALRHPDSESRVCTDRIHTGRVSLRINDQMHHIGLGRTLDGTRVILLIDHYDVRVIHATTGEIIRTLTINPEHRYHGAGNPTGGPTGPRKIKRTEPR